jgi:hypothetical protein
MQSESHHPNTLGSSVLTEEQRAKLSPQDILELLKSGNKDFTEGNLTIRNSTQRIRDAHILSYRQNKNSLFRLVDRTEILLTYPNILFCF